MAKVRGPDDAVEIVKVLVCSEHTEGHLLLGLDWSMRPCGAAFKCTCERCGDAPLVDADQLVDLSDELHAAEIVLVTFVEPERLEPLASDVARFEGLRMECSDQGVELVDHLLMAPGYRWRSVRNVSAGPGASTRW